MIMIENNGLVKVEINDMEDKEQYFMTEDQFLAIDWLIRTYALTDIIIAQRIIEEKIIDTLPNVNNIKNPR